jgi:hypothetical protein
VRSKPRFSGIESNITGYILKLDALGQGVADFKRCHRDEELGFFVKLEVSELQVQVVLLSSFQVPDSAL